MKDRFLTILIGIICIPIYGQTTFKFCEDFNIDSLSRKWRKETTKNNKYFIKKNSSSGRMNDGFLLTEMNSTNEEGVAKRAESEYGINLYDSVNSSKYLSFSFKVPKSFVFDKENLGRDVMICQWHSKPEASQDWTYYRKYNKFNRPSIALYVTTSNNKDFYVVLRYGNNGKPQFEFNDYKWSVVAVKRIELDKWNDILFHIKWSFTNTGFVAAWLNNEAFTPFNGLHNRIYGANMHNAAPNYFKFGQYRYYDDSNSHQIFFDELRIGDSFGDVTLYDVTPRMFKEKSKKEYIKNHQ